MRALVLDGSLQNDGDLAPVLAALTGELTEAGCEVEILPLREMKIAPCTGCFGCWIKTPGTCTTADAGQEIPKAMMRSDVMALFTPVTFGGYSSELKKALDRSICLISPFFTRIQGEVHHHPRYRRYPRLIGLGVQRHPDPESEQIFTTLVARHALDMHSHIHAAGTTLVGEDPAAGRERIRSLMAKVGIGR